MIMGGEKRRIIEEDVESDKRKRENVKRGRGEGGTKEEGRKKIEREEGSKRE